MFVMETLQNIQESGDRQTRTKLYRLFSATTDQYACKEDCIK